MLTVFLFCETLNPPKQIILGNYKTAIATTLFITVYSTEEKETEKELSFERTSKNKKSNRQQTITLIIRTDGY